MQLNLRQIEVFRAMMLTGSISGAAKLLFVSQPAVSRLVAYTEQRLGLTLFERIKGRLYPTPEARRLFVEVNAVYESVRRVNDVATDLLENRIGHLRIACSPNLGQSVVATAISEFYRRFPHVRIILHTMIPSVLQQAVLAHQVELGVAFVDSVHPNVAVKRIDENRLMVVLPCGHPLASADAVRLADLAEEPLIGYGSEIPMGQLLRRLINESGCCIDIKTEVQQAHVACALVQAGAGVSIVDELTMAGICWDRIVARPFEPAQCAPVSVLHPALTPLSRPASEFIETLEWSLSKVRDR
ncbi:HTH-type transcriptional regulator BenM [Pandoraea iniqua]|uniref:HTH-type transcriptional regulator BenM n=1 Tax=Pandoraea iniqua TaxID=2508288 RepID=A0A5E4VUK5_9BURK|nr:LysR family transcriptional regulator [Pandoraea iniqua]VVE15186.1 HTH-type transcriptional regulator BenM [Pandoraea iniqua]